MKQTKSTISEALDRVYGLINEKRRESAHAREEYQFSESKVFRELMSCVNDVYDTFTTEYETYETWLMDSMDRNSIDISNVFYDGGQIFVEYIRLDGQLLRYEKNIVVDDAEGMPTAYDLENTKIYFYPRWNGTERLPLVIKYKPDFDSVPLSEENLNKKFFGLSEGMLDAAIMRCCSLLKLMDEDGRAAERFDQMFKDRSDRIVKPRPGFFRPNYDEETYRHERWR